MRGRGMAWRSAWIGESGGLRKLAGRWGREEVLSGGVGVAGVLGEAGVGSAWAAGPWPRARRRPEVAVRPRKVRRVVGWRSFLFMGKGGEMANAEG
jgi:hypothetical protein